MRRDHATARVVLLAAGVGTVLGAGAGIASAAEDVPVTPAAPGLDQASALQGLGPNLSLTGGESRATGTSHDVGTVSGDDLAALGGLTDGQFSGLGSGASDASATPAGLPG